MTKNSITFTILVSLYCLGSTQPQLKFVIEAFRHGSRFPFVDDYYWDAKDQVADEGELTPTGMRQHYILGQKLREQYIEKQQFLSAKFNHTEMYVRSTDVNRTILSALSQLTGLYPPGTGPEIPANIDPELLLPPYKGVKSVDIGNIAIPFQVQPFPVRVSKAEEDFMMFSDTFCPNINKLTDYWSQNPLIRNEINIRYNETFQKLNTILQVQDEEYYPNITQSENIWDALITDLYNNRPLPLGLTDQLWSELTELDSLVWMGQYGASETVKKLLNTQLLRQYLEYLDPIVTKTQKTNLKWVMFSGHDYNIANLQAALNITDFQCLYDKFTTGSTSALNCYNRPYFAANILLELFENEDNSFYVKIKYDGNYIKMCEKDSEICQYDEFKQRLQNFFIDQDFFNKECGVKVTKVNDLVQSQVVTQEVNEPLLDNIWFYIAMFQLILVIICSILIYKILRAQKQQGQSSQGLVNKISLTV